MTAKDQAKTASKGAAAQAADDLAAVRGLESVAADESTKEFDRQMQVARRVMRENRNVLRELAK